MFSRSERLWNSKEETENTPTDKTEEVIFGMKQNLSSKMLSFLRNSNNKYHFVALYRIVRAILWLFVEKIAVAPLLKQQVNQSSFRIY